MAMLEVKDEFLLIFIPDRTLRLEGILWYFVSVIITERVFAPV